MVFLFLFVGSVLSICHWGKYDIMFVVDASGSISSSEFDQMKDFLNDFIALLHVHPFYVNVGMIQFACTGDQEVSLPLNGDYYYSLDFTDTSNPNSVQQSPGGCTNMHEGLEMAFNNLFNPNPRSAPKVVLILSDGATGNPAADTNWADRIKNEGGALIFGIGVGIGGTAASTHMTNLCNRPEFYHDVSDFDALSSTIQSIGAYLPCGLDPVLTAIALLPFIVGGLCCCLLLMALLGGIALLFLARFQVPKAPPKEDIPVDQSMYYVSGQQTAVNWGKDGMVSDTQFRPGDMGMGENFGRNKGIDPEDIKARRKENAKKKRKWCVIL